MLVVSAEWATSISSVVLSIYFAADTSEVHLFFKVKSIKCFVLLVSKTVLLLLYRVSQKYPTNALATKDYVNVHNKSNVFRRDCALVQVSCHAYKNPKPFAQTGATHYLQKIGLCTVSCSGNGGMCYLVQWKQIYHSNPAKLSQRAARSSIFLQSYHKMGSKHSRPWFRGNSKPIWESFDDIWGCTECI